MFLSALAAIVAIIVLIVWIVTQDRSLGRWQQILFANDSYSELSISDAEVELLRDSSEAETLSDSSPVSYALHDALISSQSIPTSAPSDAVAVSVDNLFETPPRTPILAKNATPEVSQLQPCEYQVPLTDIPLHADVTSEPLRLESTVDMSLETFSREIDRLSQVRRESLNARGCIIEESDVAPDILAAKQNYRERSSRVIESSVASEFRDKIDVNKIEEGEAAGQFVQTGASMLQEDKDTSAEPSFENIPRQIVQEMIESALNQPQKRPIKEVRFLLESEDSLKITQAEHFQKMLSAALGSPDLCRSSEPVTENMEESSPRAPSPTPHDSPLGKPTLARFVESVKSEPPSVEDELELAYLGQTSEEYTRMADEEQYMERSRGFNNSDGNRQPSVDCVGDSIYLNHLDSDNHVDSVVENPEQGSLELFKMESESGSDKSSPDWAHFEELEKQRQTDAFKGIPSWAILEESGTENDLQMGYEGTKALGHTVATPISVTEAAQADAPAVTLANTPTDTGQSSVDTLDAITSGLLDQLRRESVAVGSPEPVVSIGYFNDLPVSARLRPRTRLSPETGPRRAVSLDTSPVEQHRARVRARERDGMVDDSVLKPLLLREDTFDDDDDEYPIQTQRSLLSELLHHSKSFERTAKSLGKKAGILKSRDRDFTHE